MNIYEDYANYISECQELIEEMIQYNSSVYYAIADVLKVTDYIYQKNEKKETFCCCRALSLAATQHPAYDGLYPISDLRSFPYFYE